MVYIKNHNPPEHDPLADLIVQQYREHNKHCLNPRIPRCIVDNIWLRGSNKEYPKTGIWNLVKDDRALVVERKKKDGTVEYKKPSRDNVEYHIDQMDEVKIFASRVVVKKKREIKLYKLNDKFKAPEIPIIHKPPNNRVLDKLINFLNAFLWNFQFFERGTCDLGVAYAHQIYKIHLETLCLLRRLDIHFAERTNDANFKPVIKKTSEDLTRLRDLTFKSWKAFAEYSNTGVITEEIYDWIGEITAIVDRLSNNFNRKGDYDLTCLFD